MQFLAYSEVPETGIGQVFKNAAWRGLLWVTVIMAVITAYTAIPKGEPTNPVLIAVPGTVTLLAGLLLLWRLRQAMGRRNWLIKAADNGLYINLQSNTGAPLAEGAPEVFFVPREAIASISRVRELRTLPERHGRYKNHYTYFDIALRSPAPDQLLIGLAQIRRNPRLRSGIGIRRDIVGAVRLHDRHTIRLVWDWMAPRELAAAQWFEARYPSKPLEKVNAPGWEDLSQAARETYIDTLWEWGHVQDAVQLSSLLHNTSPRKAAMDLADRLG